MQKIKKAQTMMKITTPSFFKHYLNFLLTSNNNFIQIVLLILILIKFKKFEGSLKLEFIL